MGEYAKYKGKEIKIGTCEVINAIRHSERHLVSKLPNNIDLSINHDGLFFRFPFPCEDGKDLEERNAPPLIVPDYYGLRECKHQSVQFTAQNGYLISLPCPESAEAESHKFHKNGYGGAVQIEYQKTSGNKLLLAVRCRACRSLYSCDAEDALEIANSFIKAPSDRYSFYQRTNFHQIAWRIMEGYQLPTNPIAQELHLSGWQIKSHLCDDYGYRADYIKGDWQLTAKRADQFTPEKDLTSHVLALLNLLRKYTNKHDDMDKISIVPTNPQIPTA